MTPSVVQVLRREVRRLLRARDLDAAHEALARLELEEPLSAETRGLRLEWLLAAGRLEEARPAAQQLVALFPRSAGIRMLAGQVAYADRRWADAAAHFRESDALFPHWRSKHMLGKTLTQLGQLEAAEALLNAVADTAWSAHRDLAWLYERGGDHERALREIERHLERFADDALARAQALRLRAKQSSPEELVSEVDAMLDLGEDVTPELVPEYVRTLLATGRAAEARRFVAAQRATLEPRIATRIAWEAYKLQAFDLATDLFLDVLGLELANAKLLTALEAAARRSGRTSSVLAAYERHAPEHRSLYGRIKRLQRHA